MVKREAHNLETVIACLGSNPRSATIAPELDITPVKTRRRTEDNVPWGFGHLRSVCRAGLVYPGFKLIGNNAEERLAWLFYESVAQVEEQQGMPPAERLWEILVCRWFKSIPVHVLCAIFTHYGVTAGD